MNLHSKTISCNKNIILFDDRREYFMPLSHLRAIASLKVGILTIQEKWEYALGQEVFVKTSPLLQALYSSTFLRDTALYINATYLPTPSLVSQILKLSLHQAILDGNTLVAIWKKENAKEKNIQKTNLTQKAIRIQYLHDIITYQREELKKDFKVITQNKTSDTLPNSIYTVNPQEIFIEKNAQLNNVAINASEGPVYIGKNVTIMEHTSIRGPVSIGNHSILKMGTNLYGGTAIGEYCKIGGEIKNSLVYSYTNKGHSGYLGDSVVGQWCNFGAESSTSNMKNNYSSIRQWCYATQSFVDTQKQFCGLVIGDYSTCAIHTAFDTATVVGVCANILNSKPSKYVPDFTWGEQKEYLLEKALYNLQKALKLKECKLSETQKEILSKVFEQTYIYRKNHLL